MAGAKLDFETGYLGVERCEDPDDGKQYLRAVIHCNKRGLTISAPVTTDEVDAFAKELLNQSNLAQATNAAG